MIIINLSETTETLQIEVTGHGDDTDQSCARVSTVCDCIYLFLKSNIADYVKKDGYTLLRVFKKRTTIQTLKAMLSYIVTLEELYKNSIKVINKEKEVETNGKDN